MYVFIDEAGDTGFKIDSSRYFIIALIIFDNYTEMEKADRIIQKQKEKDNIFEEYKSARTIAKLKERFFDCIKSVKFEISYIVFDKATIKNISLHHNLPEVYNHLLAQAINNTAIENAIIKIDKGSNQTFQRQLKNYIRKHTMQGKIKSFKFENSKANNLIQLADMICGALYGSYNKHSKNIKYKLSFENKISNILVVSNEKTQPKINKVGLFFNLFAPALVLFD
jgi:hypothetical protein